MRAIMILALTLVYPLTSWANNFQEVETTNLICASYFYSDSGVGCVSKASIERDKLQVEMLKLQLQEMKDKTTTKGAKTKQAQGK